MRKRLLPGSASAGLLAVSLCLACETPPVLTVRQPLLKEADSHFSRGEYQPALLKYSAYLYLPEATKVSEASALYRMGICQFMLGQYSDARSTFTRFIRHFPDDKRLPQAREWLAKAQDHLRQEERLSQERVEMAAAEIAALREWVEQDPRDADLHFRLGEIYWRMGQYNDALDAYESAVRLDPRYLQHPSIRKRVVVRNDNSLDLRDSPVLPKPAGPIRVRDVETKYIKRSDFWGVEPTEHIYIVTGEVVNEGNRTCVGVQVEVTIYDFYESVMDSRTVQVGTMKPGQRRHFVAELNRFAVDPLDIRRCETQVFYEER